MISYKLYNPLGNITALVMGEFDDDERKSISQKIFEAEPTCEQVGFVCVKDDVAILTMAGGEFCGNASMCTGLMTGKSKVLCSGNAEVMNVTQDGEFTELFCKDVPRGIEHTIIIGSPDKEEAEQEIRKETVPSGYMFFENNVLTPLVYIPSINTLFWEKACASGAIATADYLYHLFGEDINIDLQLPGGVMKVKVDKDGHVLREKIEYLCERNL